MDTTTKVCLSDLNRFMALNNLDPQPHHATVYDIPERPRVPVPKVSLLRYEDRPTTDSEGGEKRRVPQMKYTRPHSKHQTETTGADPDPVSTSDSDGPGEPPLTDDVGQFEPEYFRDIIKGMSADRLATPNGDLRAFFENLKNYPQTRNERTLVLRNSPASEAIDARPR